MSPRNACGRAIHPKRRVEKYYSGGESGTPGNLTLVDNQL